MNKSFNTTLPCLQSIGPWWSEIDKRTLYCYLKKIFTLDSSYLASLSSSEYVQDGVVYRLSEHDIDMEYESFKNSFKKTVSCALIRRTEFSFGWFNKRLCDLCPYCKSYKNYQQDKEILFLYYLTKIRNISLSYVLEKNEKSANDISDYFISYFPVYVNEILINTLPLSLIVKQFLDIAPNEFREDYELAKAKVLDKAHEDILARIKNYGLKEYLEKYEPSYENQILESADNLFSFMEETNKNTFVNLKRTAGNMLFSCLKNEESYIPKNKSEYLFEPVSIFPVKDNDYISDYKDDDSAEDTALNKEPVIQPDFDEITSANIILPENPLSEYEDEEFLAHKNLDDALISADLSNDYGCAPENAVTPLPLSVVSNMDLRNPSEPVFPKTEIITPEIPKQFQEFYDIEENDSIYFYGMSDKTTDDAILSVFLEGCNSISMEPVSFKSAKGILMHNSIGSMLFYPLPEHGVKIIRKVSDMNISIYSSNSYYLQKYLISSKVYKMKIHDVGMSVSLSEKRSIFGICDFTKKDFYSSLADYEDIYLKAVAGMNEYELNRLKLLEAFTPLLFSDGSKPPFEKMDSLSSQKDSCTYEYRYNSKLKPLLPGFILNLRAFSEKGPLDENTIKEIYMDTCIEINKDFPFYNGSFYILSIGESGLYLLLTGTGNDIKKGQLYFTSCARRCFALNYPDKTPVLLKENIIKL